MQGNEIMLDTILNTAYHSDVISKLNFIDHEVLRTERDRIMRMASILRATTLESIHPTEVIITLEARHQVAKVRTRVMATGDERIMLDGGITIPIHCIRSIEFPESN